MKLTIKFTHGDLPQWPCVAIVRSEDGKLHFAASAETWAEAEAEALEKAKAQLNAGPPPTTKEIEI